MRYTTVPTQSLGMLNGEFANELNGKPTYAGRTWKGKKIEGLLFNSRMVQGIFDDLNPETRPKWAYPDTKKWDPERNTREFLAAMPEWRSTACWRSRSTSRAAARRATPRTSRGTTRRSPPTGSLRPEYMARLETILDKADELGMVVILGVFYFGQDERLKDEAAVKRASTTPSTGCSTRATATC